MGRVLGVEVADDVARIRCESAQVSLKRIGLRRLYSRKCSHVLYSSACGASPITASAFVLQSLWPQCRSRRWRAGQRQWRLGRWLAANARWCAPHDRQ
jgi:hypothetical protein